MTFTLLYDENVIFTADTLEEVADLLRFYYKEQSTDLDGMSVREYRDGRSYGEPMTAEDAADYYAPWEGGRDVSDEATMFKVMVTRSKRGHYEVEVWLSGGDEYAKTSAPDLWTALRMAVPYMASAAEPDPFADLMSKVRREGS